MVIVRFVDIGDIDYQHFFSSYLRIKNTILCSSESYYLEVYEYLLCFIYHIYNGRLKTSRIFAMLYLLYIQRKIEDILVE